MLITTENVTFTYTLSQINISIPTGSICLNALLPLESKCCDFAVILNY